MILTYYKIPPPFVLINGLKNLFTLQYNILFIKQVGIEHMLPQYKNDEAMICKQENVENTSSKCANEEPIRSIDDLRSLEPAKNGISI